jgi:tRNA threonylcarbamoyl adenosine modification protein (Sua5/YciO/YrdC/YwlC family)
MSARYDCTDAAQRVTGLAEATASLRKGDLAVIPTDTVYGLAADAFSPPAVTSLLAAKGRDRQMPPPVLVGTVRAATALVEDLSASAKDLIDEFWPGGLTLVMRANRNLIWDLGDTKGTVAVRMPLHELTLELLKQTGPLAVSSANRSGAPPATTAADAEAQLGEAVAVYLDGGPCSGDVPSTIVDLTGAVPKLLRRGVISIARLREVVTLAVDDEWMEDDSGPVADGTVADGTAADDPVADGTVADGTAADHPVADDPMADGTAADGAVADGTAPGGTAPGGAAAGGTAAE